MGRNSIYLRSKDKKKESEQIEKRSRRTKNVLKISSEKEDLRPKSKPSSDKSVTDEYKKISKLRKCQVDVAILNNAISNLITSRNDQTTNRNDQSTTRHSQQSSSYDKAETGSMASITTESKEEIESNKNTKITNKISFINPEEKLNIVTDNQNLNTKIEKLPIETEKIEVMIESDSPLDNNKEETLLKEIKDAPVKENATNVVDFTPNTEKITIGESITDLQEEMINENENMNEPNSPPLNDETSKLLTKNLEMTANNEKKQKLTKEIVHQSACEVDLLKDENNLKETTFRRSISLNEGTDTESHQPLNQRKRKRKSNRTGFPSKIKKKKISYSILREKVERKKHSREKSLPSCIIRSARPMRECKKEKEKEKEKNKEKEKEKLTEKDKDKGDSKLDEDTKVSGENSNSLKRPGIKPRGRPPKMSRLNEDLKNEVTQKIIKTQHSQENSITENLTNILKNRIFNKLEEAGSSIDPSNLTLHEASDDRDT